MDLVHQNVLNHMKIKNDQNIIQMTKPIVIDG